MFSPTKTPGGFLHETLAPSPLSGSSTRAPISLGTITSASATSPNHSSQEEVMPLIGSIPELNNTLSEAKVLPAGSTLTWKNAPSSARSTPSSATLTTHSASGPQEIAPLVPMRITATSVDGVDAKLIKNNASSTNLFSTTNQSAKMLKPSPDTVNIASLELSRLRKSEREKLHKLRPSNNSERAAETLRPSQAMPTSSQLSKSAPNPSGPHPLTKWPIIESTATLLMLNAPLVCSAIEIGNMAVRRGATLAGVSRVFFYAFAFMALNAPGTRTNVNMKEASVSPPTLWETSVNHPKAALEEHAFVDDDCCHAKIKDLTFLASGGTHDVWVLTFYPDPLTANREEVCRPGSKMVQDKVILRMRRQEDFNPNVVAQVRHEVGVRQFVSSHLGSLVPTPYIYLWNDGHNGETVPFIAEEFIEGELLCRKWRQQRPSESEKNAVLKQMADILVNLATPKFGAMGGFHPDVVGPWEMVEPSMFEPGRERLRHRKFYNIGPYRTVREYVKAMFEKEICAYENFVDQDWEEIGWSAEYAETFGTPEEFLTYLINKRRAMEDDDTAEEAERFVICHSDLAGRNIMIGPDGKIAAILDWEWAAILPVDEIFVQVGEQRDPEVDFFCFLDPAVFPEEQWGPPDELPALLEDEKAKFSYELKEHFKAEAERRDWNAWDIYRATKNYPDEDFICARYIMQPITTPNYTSALQSMRENQKQQCSSEPSEETELAAED